MNALDINTPLNTYADFAGLNKLKYKAEKDQSSALNQVSKQFESLFISMMLKTMREANQTFSKGSYLSSSQTRFYQQLFDSQISVTMSQGKGIGIAKVLERQLSQSLPSKASDKKASVLHPEYPSIADYPRTLPTQVTKIKLKKLAETLIKIDDSVNKLKNTTSVDASSKVKIDLLNNNLPDRFSTPEDYVKQLYPLARQVNKETGVNAKLMLAQSALETGWGRSIIKNNDHSSSHNLFGIKADSRWQGNVASVVTTEYKEGIPIKEKAAFRSYSSYLDSFRDYAEFLNNNVRYRSVFQHLDNPEQFAQSLQDAGYATDPNYALKIKHILGRGVLAEASLPKDSKLKDFP